MEIGIITNEISREIKESKDLQTLLIKWTDSWFYKLIQKQTLALLNVNIDEYVNYEQIQIYVQNLLNWVANNTNFVLKYVQGFIMNITSTFTTFGTMMSALYFGLNVYIIFMYFRILIYFLIIFMIFHHYQEKIQIKYLNQFKIQYMVFSLAY